MLDFVHSMTDQLHTHSRLFLCCFLIKLYLLIHMFFIKLLPDSGLLLHMQLLY